MHLTNYSINKHNDKGYVHTDKQDVLTDNDGTKRTLSSIYETLKKQGVDIEVIKRNIADTCGKTMQMYGPLIDHQVYQLTGGSDLKGKPF